MSDCRNKGTTMAQHYRIGNGEGAVINNVHVSAYQADGGLLPIEPDRTAAMTAAIDGGYGHMSISLIEAIIQAAWGNDDS